MTTKPKATMSRRASFKLATAVSTLAAGLGATLDPAEAHAAGAEPLKLTKSKIGALTIKLFKLQQTAKGETSVLVDTVELASVAHKLEEPGMYTIKLQSAIVGAKLDKPVEPTTFVEQKIYVAKG